MRHTTITVPALTIGLDLGDKRSHLFAMGGGGEVIADETISMTPKALSKRFGEFEPARVAIEAGAQSQWVQQCLESLGHQVVVANAAALGNKKQRRKNDRSDALELCRKARSDPAQLRPIRHRHLHTQADLALVRARDSVVRSRSQAVNTVRSLVKAFGERLPAASTPAFAKKVCSLIPPKLKPAVDPLLETIERLTATIRHYDKSIQRLCEEKYPETARLIQVQGVSFLTALAYVLTLEDPRRFRTSRSAGAFLGLVPALNDSGSGEPQLKIAKAGDKYLRRLMVTAAHYNLGPFAGDSDLRRHGEAIARRGGKNAKRRAVVAVARKLAVLLHRLWASEDEYDPLYNAKRREQDQAA